MTTETIVLTLDNAKELIDNCQSVEEANKLIELFDELLPIANPNNEDWDYFEGMLHDHYTEKGQGLDDFFKICSIQDAITDKLHELDYNLITSTWF